MPQVIAGTGSDLDRTVAQLVKELLENNWPTAAFDPLKADIGFGLDTWDDYGDIDIHVLAARATSVPYDNSWDFSKINDPVAIHLFVRKNADQIPVNMGNAQRKIEAIIKDNAANLGQGIPALRFDGWDPIFVDSNLKDVWHAVGYATAIFWRAKA